MELKDLNAQLTEQASKELKADVQKFVDGVREHKMFEAIKELTITVSGLQKQVTLWAAFLNSEQSADSISKLIYDAMLPEYVERTVGRFMEDVEDFQEAKKTE